MDIGDYEIGLARIFDDKVMGYMLAFKRGAEVENRIGDFDFRRIGLVEGGLCAGKPNRPRQWDRERSRTDEDSKVGCFHSLVEPRFSLRVRGSCSGIQLVRSAAVCGVNLPGKARQ